MKKTIFALCFVFVRTTGCFSLQDLKDYMDLSKLAAETNAIDELISSKLEFGKYLPEKTSSTTPDSNILSAIANIPGYARQQQVVDKIRQRIEQPMSKDELIALKNANKSIIADMASIQLQEQLKAYPYLPYIDVMCMILMSCACPLTYFGKSS